MITSKEQIINYFYSGIKSTKNFKIGIEHEKFLFNNKDNKRVDYSKIKEITRQINKRLINIISDVNNHNSCIEENWKLKQVD